MGYSGGSVGVVARVGHPAWTIEIVQAGQGTSTHDLVVEFESGGNVTCHVAFHGDVEEGDLLHVFRGVEQMFSIKFFEE